MCVSAVLCGQSDLIYRLSASHSKCNCGAAGTLSIAQKDDLREGNRSFVGFSVEYYNDIYGLCVAESELELKDHVSRVNCQSFSFVLPPVLQRSCQRCVHAFAAIN